jgi:DNA-binding response OmpR family regulator
MPRALPNRVARRGQFPSTIGDRGPGARAPRPRIPTDVVSCDLASLRLGAAAAPSILVVDDDGEMLRFLEEILRDEGFAVRTAPDAFAALLRMLADAPDLVILDWRMPNMDGLALLQSIRRCFDRLPVVFITAFPGPEVRRLALQNGAAGFLAKPFSTRDLLTEIGAALRRPAAGGPGTEASRRRRDRA